MSSADVAAVEPFFALKYIRILIQSGDSGEMGSLAFHLCVTVASFQDGKRFQGPCTFFNAFLMELLNVARVETLIAARDKAVEMGWLKYVSGKAKRAAGTYSICVPKRHYDDTAQTSILKNRSSDGSSNSSSNGSSDRTSDVGSNGSRDSKPNTLDPMPNPEPDPEKKGVSAKTPKSKKGPILVDELALPDWANNHACKTAIDKFLNYRKDIGKPYKSPGHLLEQIGRFEKFGAEAFIASVSETVASGSWQGLFLPKTNGRGLFDEPPKRKQNIPSQDDVLFQQQFKIGGEEWCRIVEENNDLEAYKFQRRRQNGFA